jgi:hypothetical protein
MQINKKSWHYTWYEWTYSLSTNGVPEQTNLCRYTQRIFWMTPLIVLAYIAGVISMIMVSAMYYLIMTPFALLLGGRPFNLFSSSERELRSEVFIRYESPVYPYHFVLLAVFIWAEWMGWHHTPRLMAYTHLGVPAALLIFLGWAWLNHDSETFRLFKAWAAARKARICPVVEFKNEPTSTNVND